MSLVGFGMWAIGAAWAGGTDELRFEAVAVGDFDCSGVLGAAELYSTRAGDFVVELTLRMPADQLPRESSSSSGAAVWFEDDDGDRCQELVISTGAGDAYVVNGLDHPDVVLAGQQTAGDGEPDLNVQQRRRVTPGTVGMNIGLGHFTQWGEWADGCRDDCAAYGWQEQAICGYDPITHRPRYCSKWGCTHINMHCVLD